MLMTTLWDKTYRYVLLNGCTMLLSINSSACANSYRGETINSNQCIPQSSSLHKACFFFSSFFYIQYTHSKHSSLPISIPIPLLWPLLERAVIPSSSLHFDTFSAVTFSSPSLSPPLPLLRPPSTSHSPLLPPDIQGAPVGEEDQSESIHSDSDDCIVPGQASAGKKVGWTESRPTNQTFYLPREPWREQQLLYKDGNVWNVYQGYQVRWLVVSRPCTARAW